LVASICFRFLENPSIYLGSIGLFALFPVFINGIWRTIKFVIYELIFVARKAIEDAKKTECKRKGSIDK
jgi:hypothetical protein